MKLSVCSDCREILLEKKSKHVPSRVIHDGKKWIHKVIVACAHLSNSTSQHGALWCFSQCTGSFWLLMCPFNSTCSVLHVFASANRYRSVNCHFHCIGVCCRCPSSAIEKPVLHYNDAQPMQCELHKDLLLLAKILHQLIGSLSDYLHGFSTIGG